MNNRTVMAPIFGKHRSEVVHSLHFVFKKYGYNFIVADRFPKKSVINSFEESNFEYFNLTNHPGDASDSDTENPVVPFLKWANLLQSDPLYYHMRPYAQWADHLFDLHSPELILLWNGSASITHGVWRQVAQRKSVPICFMELGFYRKYPSSIQHDLEGVNAGSSYFKKWSYEDPLEKEESLEIRSFLDRYRENHLGDNPELLSDEEIISENSLFFPLQVHDDSQLFFYDKGWGDLIKTVQAIVKAMPDDLQLVVKAHPQDVGRYNLDAIKQSLRENDIFYEARMNTHRIIRKVRGVITINSTVGLEALIHNRPALILGDAAYYQDGLNLRWQENADLAELLRSLPDLEIDQDKRERLLYDLKKQLFIYTSGTQDAMAGNFSDEDYYSWGEKILRTANLPFETPKEKEEIKIERVNWLSLLRHHGDTGNQLRWQLINNVRLLGFSQIHLLGARYSGELLATVFNMEGIKGHIFDNDPTLNGVVIKGKTVEPLEGFTCERPDEALVICSSRSTEELEGLKPELKSKHNFSEVLTLAEVLNLSSRE